jgi:hypothetical protein
MTTWQFVADMVTNTPTVLLDLNVSPLNVASYDLSPSDYAKGYAGGSMLNGQRVVFQAAQNRMLSLSLQVVSTTSAGFAGAIESLGRQLATDNILKYQPNNTVAPVFFRTLANPGYAAEVRGVLRCAVQYQVVTLTIEAEFAAYGPRVEAVNSPFTVSNDPAAGSNGCFFDVTSVQGDTPTPLLIHATSTGVTGTPSGFMQKWTHLGVRRRGTPSAYSNVLQGETLTPANGAAITADATMSGGSKSRVTFSTTTNLLRGSNAFPSDGVARIDVRGEYRVYGRFAKTVAGDNITVQLGYGASSSTVVFNDTVTLPGTVGPYWVDLGKVPIPAFSDPVEFGFSGVNTKVRMTFVGLWAARLAGSGSLDIDVLYFVPADDLTLIAKFPATDTTYAIDGTTDEGGAVYALTSTLDEITTTATPCQMVAGGGFPEVIPGQTNRVHLIRHVDPTGAAMTGAPADPIGSTTTIHVYYWPRWRELTRT